jgi:type VI secretion system protein ImpK
MRDAPSDATGRPPNPLLEACMNVLSLTAPLLGGTRGASLGEDFRQRIAAALAELERSGFELQLDPNAVSDAKYMLVAFVDEKVLSSAWPHKATWMGRPLQLEYFGEHLAGENVFQRLTKLRQGGDRNVDVLEVYYLCLQLGFEGMYRLRGLEQLMALQVDLRAQINDHRARVPRAVSPHGTPNLGLLEKVRRDVPYWVLGVITVAGVVFGYLAFAVALERQSDHARLALKSDHQQIVSLSPPMWQARDTGGHSEGSIPATNAGGPGDAERRL